MVESLKMILSDAQRLKKTFLSQKFSEVEFQLKEKIILQPKFACKDAGQHVKTALGEKRK